MKNRPGWYTEEHDSTWERVKAAFKNDWEQTKNDFGSKSARDLNQDVDDTVKQASGSDDAFENHEQAFRFGHAAQRQYRSQHPTWNNDLETRLRQDYGEHFERDRDNIRRAYEYRYASAGGDLGSNAHIEAGRTR
ncbi:MAG TPA: hypothetical protein VFT12_12895 [Thermoanaerobaculia bacterium]|nr:hypothetical protein [Thermoanaerobaculia bacterium]